MHERGRQAELRRLGAQLKALAAFQGDDSIAAQRRLVTELAEQVLGVPADPQLSATPYDRFERALEQALRRASAAAPPYEEEGKVYLTLALTSGQHQAWQAVAQRRATDLRTLLRRLLDEAASEPKGRS